MQVWGNLPVGLGGGPLPHVGWLPNWNVFALDVSMTRRLYHSGLGLVVDYPLLPTATLNFTWDVLARRDLVLQKTLTTTHATLWPAAVGDVVIVERWEGPGGLSFPWAFLHALHRLYLTSPDWTAGEALVWRPYDRTHKAFDVDVVNLLVDGEQYNATWLGVPYAAGLNFGKALVASGRDVHAGTTLELHLKLRPEGSPTASAFLVEGSDTGETETAGFEFE